MTCTSCTVHILYSLYVIISLQFESISKSSRIKVVTADITMVFTALITAIVNIRKKGGWI